MCVTEGRMEASYLFCENPSCSGYAYLAGLPFCSDGGMLVENLGVIEGRMVGQQGDALE